jgi:hypothetical protein
MTEAKGSHENGWGCLGARLLVMGGGWLVWASVWIIRGEMGLIPDYDIAWTFGLPIIFGTVSFAVVLVIVGVHLLKYGPGPLPRRK